MLSVEDAKRKKKLSLSQRSCHLSTTCKQIELSTRQDHRWRSGYMCLGNVREISQKRAEIWRMNFKFTK